MIIIKRPDFTIREFEPDDASDVARHFGHPQVLRHVRGVAGRYTVKDAKAFIAKCRRSYSRQNPRLHYGLAIDGHIVGGVSISRHGRRAEIGYWLARPYWSRGIMTAVVKSWCRYIIRTYRLTELGGKVFTFNLASARVLQKNGFRFVTRMVNALTIDGRTFDDYIFQKKYRQNLKKH